MQSQTITVNGISLHVTTDGSEASSSVVLLHAFPGVQHEAAQEKNQKLIEFLR